MICFEKTFEHEVKGNFFFFFFFLLIKMYNTNTNYVLSVNKLFI